MIPCLIAWMGGGGLYNAKFDFYMYILGWNWRFTAEIFTAGNAWEPDHRPPVPRGLSLLCPTDPCPEIILIENCKKKLYRKNSCATFCHLFMFYRLSYYWLNTIMWNEITLIVLAGLHRSPVPHNPFLYFPLVLTDPSPKFIRMPKFL